MKNLLIFSLKSRYKGVNQTNNINVGHTCKPVSNSTIGERLLGSFAKNKTGFLRRSAVNFCESSKMDVKQSKMIILCLYVLGIASFGECAPTENEGKYIRSTYYT